jgi:hypothetical protein
VCGFVRVLVHFVCLFALSVCWLCLSSVLLSTGLVTALYRHTAYGWDERAGVSYVVSFFILALARTLEVYPVLGTRYDFSFWFYLAGCASYVVGGSFWAWHSDTRSFFHLLVTGGLVVVAQVGCFFPHSYYFPAFVPRRSVCLSPSL